MCMFSQPIVHVGATRIFARRREFGRQLLAYAMELSTATDVAMILPVPVPVGSPDDAVRFVDLSGHAELFDDLAKAFFPLSLVPQRRAAGPVPRSPQAKLIVHRVGAFDASFVPSIGAFERLDARFRLPERVLDALPTYADWGFVVFTLRAGTEQKVHPMAFDFPTRHPGALFFPTVHVHDGSLPSHERFDHHLFFQWDGDREGPVDVLACSVVPEAGGGFGDARGADMSRGPLGEWMDTSRSEGILDPGACARRIGLIGSHANEDIWVPADRPNPGSAADGSHRPAYPWGKDTDQS